MKDNKEYYAFISYKREDETSTEVGILQELIKSTQLTNIL